MRHPVLALGALTLLVPATLAAQRPAARPWVKTLARPAAELEEPFTAIGGVRELRDGRVLVVDRREKAVRLVDFASGAVTQVGREGSGPGEYGMPMSLFPLPGDSTLLLDGMNLRYLVIDPAGKMTAQSFSPAVEGGGFGLGIPRGADGAGRLYFLDRGLRPGAGMRQPSDSGAIVRYDRARKSADTVAWLRLPKLNVQTSGSANAREVRVSGPGPFTPQDELAVGLDGRVAIVHVDDYRVEWVAPNGQRVRGEPNAYTPIKVTEADKEQFRQAAQRGGMQVMVRVEGGGRGAGGGGAPPPSLPARMPEPTDWPETKPPFTAGAAVVAPDGTLWVLRTREARDPVPTYDVFDSFGALVGKVVLPRETRLVGFGRNGVYLVRRDADDLEYLARYQL